MSHDEAYNGGVGRAEASDRLAALPTSDLIAMTRILIFDLNNAMALYRVLSMRELSPRKSEPDPQVGIRESLQILTGRINAFLAGLDNRSLIDISQTDLPPAFATFVLGLLDMRAQYLKSADTRDDVLIERIVNRAEVLRAKVLKLLAS